MTVPWCPKVGVALRTAREERGLSKRAAARLAGFDELVWRQLEAGVRRIGGGVDTPYTPTDETLLAAATAVGIAPAKLFRLAGRRLNEATRVEPRAVDHITAVRREDAEFYAQLQELARLHRRPKGKR